MCGKSAHYRTQPRYRKGRTRILFLFFKVCKIESLQFAESQPQRRTYSYTSICIVPNSMFTQILRRKQMLQRVPSPFSIRSRHNLHTSSSSSSSGSGARVHQGIGSRGNVRIHRAQVISGSGGFVHRSHGLPPCLPLSPV